MNRTQTEQQNIDRRTALVILGGHMKTTDISRAKVVFTKTVLKMPKLSHFPNRGEPNVKFDWGKSEVSHWLMELQHQEWFPKWLMAHAISRGLIVFDKETKCWFGCKTEDGQRALKAKGRSLDPPSDDDRGGRPRKHVIGTLLLILGDQRIKSGDWLAQCKAATGMSKSTYDREKRILVLTKKVTMDRETQFWYALANAPEVVSDAPEPPPFISAEAAEQANRETKTAPFEPGYVEPTDQTDPVVSFDTKSPAVEEPTFNQADYAGEVGFVAVSEPAGSTETPIKAPGDHVLQQALTGQSLNPAQEAK